jgi:hypothetical protein
LFLSHLWKCLQSGTLLHPPYTGPWVVPGGWQWNDKVSRYLQETVLFG